MDIDIQAICDEYCDAAKKVFDDIFAKYVKDLSGAFHLHACMIMRNIEMKALDSLHDAKSNELDIATKAYWDAKQPDRIREDSQPTLPPEIIQYIISLAYDDEIEHYLPRGRGAAGLFESICRETVDLHLRDFLLSTTTLSISDQSQLYQATLISRPKLEIHSFQDLSAADYLSDRISFLSVRIKSLTIYHPSDLHHFLRAFPHLAEIKCYSFEGDIQEADWKELQQAVNTCERINLRSATVASCHLAGFLSTGFFTNIVHIHIGISESNSRRSPSLEAYLDSLVHLRSLSSLELEDKRLKSGMEVSSDDWEGQSREFRPLRKLVLTSFDPDFVKCVLWRMSAVGLLEVKFSHSLYWIDTEFYDHLSDRFPLLNVLRTTTDDIHSILCRVDDCGNILAWNFPNLHKLDMRKASCDDTAIVFDWLPVLQARASDEARSLGVTPINCFCVRLSQFLDCSCDEERMLNVERMLDFYEIEKIIPNFVYTIDDDFRESLESADYDIPA